MPLPENELMVQNENANFNTPKQVFELVKQQAQFTHFNVIVKEMEKTRQAREQHPDQAAEEATHLVHALVTQAPENFPAEADAIDAPMEATYREDFLRGLYEAVIPVLEAHVNANPAALTLDTLQAEYQASCDRVKTGCLSSVLKTLLSRRSAYQYQGQLNEIPPAQIRAAIEVLKNAPHTFNTDALGPELQRYFTVILLPRLNAALAGFDVTFRDNADVEASLARFRQEQVLHQEAQARYQAILNLKTMSSVDMTDLLQNPARLRERHVHLLVLSPESDIPNQLNYHPVLGYRLNNEEQRRVLMNCPMEVNYQDAAGNTLLHHAVANQNYVLAHQLIRMGARIDIQNQHGRVASDYSSNPAKIEELNALFQAQEAREPSSVVRELAMILEKQRARNQRVAEKIYFHDQQLFNQRVVDTIELDTIVTQARGAYHEEEILKQVRELHARIQTSGAGRSQLKSRLGKFLNGIKRGRIVSVRAAEFGCPRDIAAPTLALAPNARVQALEEELRIANGTIVRLREEKSAAERARDEAVIEATRWAEAATVANQQLVQRTSQCSELTAEVQQLKTEKVEISQALSVSQKAASDAQKATEVSQRAADEANGRYADLSAQFQRMMQMVEAMQRQNQGASVPAQAGNEQRIDSAANTSRFFSAQ